MVPSSLPNGGPVFEHLGRFEVGLQAVCNTASLSGGPISLRKAGVGMLAFCHKCWAELHSTPTVCPSCGASVDIYSRDYEKKLISLILRSGAEKRAQICWVLGHRAKRGAVPALIELLRDPDAFVQIAAIRALGEIGDASAVAAIESVRSGSQPAIREIARKALAMLGVHQS
jgi:hypothetical protein